MISSAHPSKTSWDQVEVMLSADQREAIARILLDALHSECWYKIDLEIRDHRLHAIDITQRINIQS